MCDNLVTRNLCTLEQANAAQNRHTDKLLREIMEEMMKSEAFKNPFAMFGKKDKS